MVRRIALITILSLAGSAAVFAQRGGGGFHGGGGMGGGFHGGGMGGGFRGGGMGGGFRGGGMGGGFRGGMGGGFRGGMGGGFRGGMGGGFRGNNGFRGNFGFRNRFNRFGFSPFFNNGLFGWPWWGAWGWPVWGGWPLWDSSWDSSDGGYSPASYGSYGGYPYPENYSAGPTPVIINQNLGSAPPPPPHAPTITEYTVPPPTQVQSSEPPLFLLAFQDNVIRAVLAYWVDGTTLHYVTLEHEQKQAPLSTVDRTLSERLNHERNVTFQLPR